MRSYINQERTGKSNFNAIDVGKFVSAILVVTIHVNPLETRNYLCNFILTDIIARLAVPYFFIASAFFLFRKLNNKESEKIISKYIKRLMHIYIIWSIIYTPIIIYNNTQNEDGFVVNLIRYIRNFFLVGTYTHLWYILALLISVFIVYQLKYKLKLNEKTLFVISFILYIIGVFGQAYFGLISKVPVISDIYQLMFVVFSRNATRSGLFFAPVFIVIGMSLSNKKDMLSTKHSIIGFLFSFTALVIEVFLLDSLVAVETRNMYFALVPVVYYLFMLICNLKLKDALIYHMLRDYSIIIFLTHMLFLFLSKYILDAFEVDSTDNLYQFTFTILASIVFSVVLRFIEAKNCFQILRKIH